MTVFILLVSAILLLLTAIISIGLCVERRRSKRPAFGSVDYNPFVSIIIPARNEADNITALLNSFEHQSNKNFELILIDDRSEDNSLELMKNFAAKSSLNIKIIANTESPGSSNPKVNVLLKGIEKSVGELYFFTDADCCAGKDWVKKLVNAFADEQTGIVCGLLTLTSEDNMLCRFQNFDHFYRMLYAFGAIGLGAPVGCFGNNLAIRRKAYLETGGYEDLRHSATEDAELIARVKAAGNYKVRALFDEATFIETIHKKSWSEHATQSVRWAAGAVFSTNRVAQAGFFALMLMTSFCLLSIIPAFIQPLFLIFPAIMYLFLLFSAIVLGLTGSVNKSYWKALIPSVLLYPIVYVQSFFRAIIDRRIDWKGTIISWRKNK